MPATMGHLDQLAKQTFAEETEVITHGAVSFQVPPEMTLSDVRGDGLFIVHDPSRLTSLVQPWREAREHTEIVVELKMPGDHLDPRAVQRALLRRLTRHVQRIETTDPHWENEEPIWVVAPSVPDVLRRMRKVHPIAPGCFSIHPSAYAFVWIAANELPLTEELIPFLVARSGRALVEFSRWVLNRRPPIWVMRMLQIVPMTNTEREELLHYLPPTDDPEILERRRHLTELMLAKHPEVSQKLIKKGLKKGLKRGHEQGIEKGLQALAHLFERRIGRPLTEEEHHAVHERLLKLGPDRLGDVVLDLDTKALVTWLADPNAR
jgi:hypothetical protein